MIDSPDCLQPVVLLLKIYKDPLQQSHSQIMLANNLTRFCDAYIQKNILMVQKEYLNSTNGNKRSIQKIGFIVCGNRRASSF
jgi:hypothetical protein